MSDIDSVDPDDVEMNIPIAIVLTVLTCGIYTFIWNYKQMWSLNQLLGKKHFSFTAWFFLLFLTCGLYHIYHEYKMAEAITDIQENNSQSINHSLIILSLVLSILGLTIITDAVQQHEINGLVQ